MYFDQPRGHNPNHAWMPGWMVEDNRLVTLGAGLGAGAVWDLRVVTEDGREVLRYSFPWGSSGIQRMEGRYVLGSGQPATWERVE